MTTAVAPLGFHFAPTSASTSSTLPCSWASSVMRRSLPGTACLVSCTTIGSPTPSLTIRRVAVGAVQDAVVRELEAAEPGAVDADRADDLRGQPATRVVAPPAGDELQAVDLELADLLGLGGRQVAREVDEAALGVELLEHAGLRDAQQRRQARGGPQRRRDEIRRRRDVGGGLGDGELEAVAVGDRAAPRRHVDLVDLLRRGGALQRRGLDAAEPQRAPAGQHEQSEEDREQQADAALRQTHCMTSRWTVGRRTTTAWCLPAPARRRRRPFRLRWRARRSSPERCPS